MLQLTSLPAHGAADVAGRELKGMGDILSFSLTSGDHEKGLTGALALGERHC